MTRTVQFIPKCPVLSPFVLLVLFGPRTGTNWDKRGQTGTQRDMSGQIKKRPHLGSTPIQLSSSTRDERRQIFTTKIHANLIFRRVSRFFVKGGQTCTFRTCTLFFAIFLRCLTLLGARDCPLFNFPSMEAIERRGGKKAWKGGVRRSRPKFWQRTKCTFEKCTFVPS